MLDAADLDLQSLFLSSIVQNYDAWVKKNWRGLWEINSRDEQEGHADTQGPNPTCYVRIRTYGMVLVYDFTILYCPT